MKLIDAAESGYASANSYFLLLWGIVAVVGLTAFFEQREFANEQAEATRVVELHKDLIRPVENTAQALTEVVAAGPHFDEPETLFAEMRSNNLRAKVYLTNLQTTLARRHDIDIPTEIRMRINLAINPMRALLNYNVPEIVDAGMVPVEGEAGLLLAEIEAGSLGIAPSVGELRIEDAVRYLWLSAIPMRDLMSEAAQLERWVARGNVVDLELAAKRLERFSELALSSSNRDVARNLWSTWLKALPPSSDDPEARLERLAAEQLTLSEPVDQSIEALRTLSLVEARRTGSEVDVKLPGVSLPIRLLDAIIFLPTLIGFCLLAIYVYTSRGLRYGTRENLQSDDSHQIVGKTPVFYALYGVSKPVGVVIAALALGLPIVITWALPTFFISSALRANWASWVFWVAMMFNLLVLLALLVQFSKVTELIDQGDVLEEE